MHGFTRRFLVLFTALGCVAPLAATAQAWPQRPIKIIVPYTVGGASDITARLLAERLALKFGQPVTVENRAGASGTIGTEAVANAAADGYTLAFVASSHVVNKALFPALAYDPIKSFTPIIHTANVQLVLVVPAILPANTMAEVIALAKAKPGTFSYASSGSGSNPQFFAEMFKQAAGVDMVHVPYKGSTAAHVDLMAGRTQLMFDALASVSPHVKSGKLKVLAVAGATRSRLLPDVPTVSEAGLPGFGATSWGALLAPAGTPKAVIDRLNQESAVILNSAEVKERLGVLGAEVVASTPEQLADLMRREETRYTKMVRDLNIKPE
ncbi:MAG TPA: tripartite tricarboxylate transporter substrate binding protein [Polaromonas sp.]|uniref:Bug family tripartite tricarboxylate transporter substrate binding protein n=1 Tax=Polaromonas sp. TaxID=1869339 RepID=UPI002D2271E1|nr:tripartite tricarboxylate transporter substrate binding protein [Polaromonas sp.]HYW55569.1 tripartite tricarboxylate transporter substrate binding protein [Polaromonas sp.]